MSGRSGTVVGWFAFAGQSALCDRDACVIAGSHEAMRRIVTRMTTPRLPSFSGTATRTAPPIEVPW